MSTANQDSFDLKAVQTGGLIREDVLNKIGDISNVPLELMDRIGTDTTENTYQSWTYDDLGAPDTTNAVVDGADATGNDTQVGERVGNFVQGMDKVIRVSTLANASNTIGYNSALTRQLSRGMRRLKRDLNAILTINQASQADDGDSTPGLLGSLPSWLVSNVEAGGGAVAGGFTHADAATGVVAARTPGTARAATQTLLDNVVDGIYDAGGEPTLCIMRAPVKRGLSKFLFSDTAQIAQLWKDTGGSTSTTAMSSVSVYVNDFATLELVADRLQQPTSAGESDLFVISPEYLACSSMVGWRADQLGRTGTADNYQLFTANTLQVLSEKAHGAVFDIDESAAWTA